MIQIQTFTFNALAENTYVLYDETLEAIIIDPGCYDKQEQAELANFITSKNLTVKALLNTHGHVDHVLGNHFVKEKYGVKLYIHPTDEQTLRSVQVYAPAYGFNQYRPTEPDAYLKEGETFTFGHTSLQVLFVPGHAPGHVAFYNAEQKICISGDVLFYRSIGRTDLPGGNFDTLRQSIFNQLFTLPDDVTIYPGHGPTTRIGDEKRLNPFLK